MGLGSTAKKIQTVADVAEKTYKRLNDLREQMTELRGTVEETGDRVETLEREVAAQRAVLDAVAEEHDLDPERIRGEVAAEAEGARASEDGSADATESSETGTETDEATEPVASSGAAEAADGAED